jgi:hypothetical protein
MSSDYDPEVKPTKKPFVKKTGTNKTISIAQIQQQFLNIMKNVKIGGSVTATKGEIVERLTHNVEQLGKVRTLYIQVFTQQQERLEEYASGYKAAKQEFSRKMYDKKLQRTKAALIDLLHRMSILDSSIQNLEERKNNLLKPDEPTEPVAEVVEETAAN